MKLLVQITVVDKKNCMHRILFHSRLANGVGKNYYGQLKIWPVPHL
uniref:Uncharacterized protein n=1 Tax=Amphimedon queenslandica TaxID=400682 RepID=A0A1X7TQR3_AMPQE